MNRVPRRRFHARLGTDDRTLSLRATTLNQAKTNELQRWCDDEHDDMAIAIAVAEASELVPRVEHEVPVEHLRVMVMDGV